MSTLAILLFALLPVAAAAEGLSGRLAEALSLPASSSVELDNPRFAAADDARLENLSWDPRTNRVTALVDGTRITAKVRRTVELPVLVRYVAPGEAIGADDVALLPIDSARLGQGVAAEAADLVGKTPKRAVRPGEPVRLADVRSPLVIRKGELVTLLVEKGALRLTAQGRAAEDGGMGATVRVANTRSGKTVDGTVAGPGMVRIEAQ